MLRKLCGLTLLCVTAPVFAADISYNFIQAGYQEIDIDADALSGISVDGNGYGIGGAVELNDNVFVGVDYAKADFDFGVDFDTLSLGIGYHVPLTTSSDFYGMLSYVKAEVSASGFGSADEDGYAATIGVRGMIGERFELNGSLGYVDYGNGGDSTAVGAGILYNITDNVAAGFSVDFDDDVTAYGIGFRLYF